MKTRGFRRPPIAMAAVGLWLLTFLPGIWDGAAAWAIRAACVALWTWLTAVLFSAPAPRPALAAPLFLLSTSAFWLYAIVPVVFATAFMEIPGKMLTVLALGTPPDAIARFIGSEGELAVLRFALVGIATAAWITPENSGAEEGTSGIMAEPPRWITLGLGVGAGAIYAAARHLPTDLAHYLSAELIRQADFAALVVFCVAVALAALRAVARAPGALLDLVVLGAAAVAFLFSGGLKLVVFVFGASLLAVALARRSSLTLGITAAASSIALISVVAVQNPGQDLHMSFPEYSARIVVSKVILRQIETVDCLTGVIRAHDGAYTESANVFYFASGLVPRALWPEKPNLSQSGKAVIQYCDPSMAPGSDAAGHSAAATLLWEPLARGGPAAQVVAQVLTLLILAGLSRAWIGGNGYAAAGTLALAPWAVDFDQHFSLYIANLVKAGLVAGSCLLLVAWGRRVFRW